jgi:hypothetical protein
MVVLHRWQIRGERSRRQAPPRRPWRSIAGLQVDGCGCDVTPGPPTLSAAAGSALSARCSSGRGRRVDGAAAHHRGRGALDGRLPVRRVWFAMPARAHPAMECDVRLDGPLRQAAPGPRPTDGMVACPPEAVREARTAAAVAAPLVRRGPAAGLGVVLAAPTGADAGASHPPQAASSSGARWCRQDRSLRSQAVARATGSWRSILASRISPTTSA